MGSLFDKNAIQCSKSADSLGKFISSFLRPTTWSPNTADPMFHPKIISNSSTRFEKSFRADSTGSELSISTPANRKVSKGGREPPDIKKVITRSTAPFSP
jgi:hypothetical protein